MYDDSSDLSPIAGNREKRKKKRGKGRAGATILVSREVA
jgi:hypothetical protein